MAADNNDFTHEFQIYSTDLNAGTMGTGKFLLFDNNINAVKVESIDNIKIGGGSNGKILATDGEGNLRWISAAAGGGGVSSYNDLDNLPDLTLYVLNSSLATVATTGSYNDLLNKPTLFSGAYADLTGKPTLITSYTQLTDKPSIPTVPTTVSSFTNDAGYLTSVTNISGNAATVSNGVYTNGSYSNPAWITSLAYSKLTDAPSLADVATSGAYADLTGKPTLATVATSGSYSDLTNRPSIFSGSYTDLTNTPVLFDGAYLSLTGLPNLAAVATSGSYDDLSNKPSIPSLDGYATEAWVNSQGFGSGGAGVTSYNDLTDKPAIPTSLSDFGITAGLDGQVLTLNSSLTPVWATPSSGGTSYDQSLNTTDDVTFSTVTTDRVENADGRITNTYYNGTLLLGGSATQTPVSILIGGAGPRNEWAFTPDGKLTLPEVGTGLGWTNTDTAPVDTSNWLASSTISFDKNLGIVLNNEVGSTNHNWVLGKDGKLKFPRDGAGNTDPYLSIEGGATPTIQSTDASGMGPADLAIQSNYLNLSGYSGAKISLHADAGEIAGDNNLVLISNNINTGATQSWIVESNGTFKPGSDNLQDLGTPTARIRHIYVGPGSISVGDSVITESSTGKLVLPGVTRATTLFANEVEDSGDQTTTFTSAPTLIDAYEYSIRGGATADGTYVAATYTCSIDGDGELDDIEVDAGGTWTQAIATYNRTNDMYAYTGSNINEAFNASNWTQIPFNVRAKANDVEYEFNNGGGGASALEDLDDVQLEGPVEGSVLTWDASAEKWVNRTPTGGQGTRAIVKVENVNGSLVFTNLVGSVDTYDFLNSTSGGFFKLNGFTSLPNIRVWASATGQNTFEEVSSDVYQPQIWYFPGNDIGANGVRIAYSAQDIQSVIEDFDPNIYKIHLQLIERDFYIVFETSGASESSGGGGNANTGSFVFSDNFLSVNAGDQVVIQGQTDGNARIDIPNDDWSENSKALTISNTGAQGVKISTGQNNDNTWTFGQGGTLVLPEGGDIVDSTGTSVLGGGGGSGGSTTKTWTNPNNNTWTIEEYSGGWAGGYLYPTATMTYTFVESQTDVNYFMIDSAAYPSEWQAINWVDDFSFDGGTVGYSGYGYISGTTYRVDLGSNITYNTGDTITINYRDRNSNPVPSVWWDAENSPSGDENFRGAIIEYHAYCNAGTVIGKIIIAADDENAVTHMESMGGSSNLGEYEFWYAPSYGQLAVRRIGTDADNDDDEIMIQWTGKIFYGSENNC